MILRFEGGGGFEILGNRVTCYMDDPLEPTVIFWEKIQRKLRVYIAKIQLMCIPL
jgi:hypothetical protein